jgi:hypothetical protein
MLTAAATKTKPIGDSDDRRFTIIVNSVSIAAPIGLPPKMAEFCHTSNRSLLGCQRCRALLRLYFNSSATGRSPVENEGFRALGGSLQKDKGCRALGGSLQKDKGFRALGGSLQKEYLIYGRF